jgi:hypothetical protein
MKRITKTIKFLTPLWWALSALLVVFLIFSALGDPTQAAPSLQSTNLAPVYRFLDTSGAGTGVKNAISSTVPLTFYLQPPAGSTYNITRLIAVIEDSAVSDATKYGAVTITNGVTIRRVSGSSIITLTDGVAIKTNTQWARFCEVRTVTTQLQAICELEGLRLNGDRSERLEVVLNDDFSGLDGHYFMVQGYRE